MKSILNIIIGLSLSISVYAETIRLSEPVAQDANSETFGVILDKSLPTLSMQDLAVNSN